MDKKLKEQQESSIKIEELMHSIDIEKKRSEEYLTRLKYMQADFENLKKRFDRQMEEVTKYCNERIIIKLLEIVDELEMAVKTGRSSNSLKNLISGVEMTLKKLEKLLENEQVSPIDCIGKPFDPSKHNAVAKIAKSDIKESIIVEEVRKGYILKERVIRPSTVKIVVKKLLNEVSSNE